MSQNSVISLESLISITERAVTASEDALAAARLANIHATSALAAAKLALELERSKTIPTAEPRSDPLEDLNSSSTYGGSKSDDLEGSSAGVLSPVPESETVSSRCVYCQQKSCPQGRFVTYFKESNIGKKVRLVGSSWNEDMRSRVGVVEGFEDGKLCFRWNGIGKVKKLMLILQRDDVGEFQFQFCCNQDPSVQSETPEPTSVIPPVTRPDLIPSNSCFHSNLVGQLVTDYCDSYQGMTVRYCGLSGVGKNWSQDKRNRVGVIAGFRDGYLLLKWMGEDKVKKFLLSNSANGELEYQFKFCSYEAQDVRDECRGCRSSICRSGSNYEEYRASDIGLTVQYIGPDKSIARKVGTIQGVEKNYLIVRWISNNKDSKYKIVNSKGIYLFKVVCNHNSNTEKKVKKEEEEVPNVYDSEEEEYDEEPLVLLSDPKAEIMDVEMDTETEDCCIHCKMKLSKCLDGKFMSFYSEESVGRRIRYCGSFDEDLRGRVGIIEGYQDECLVIVWYGQTEHRLYPLLIPKPGLDGAVHYQDQPIVEYQFSFCCKVDQSSIRDHQMGSDDESASRWFWLKLEMYQVLPLLDLNTDSGEDRCGNCQAFRSRCLNGKYVLSTKDLQIGACLKFVGQKENLRGNLGTVTNIKKGFFKLDRNSTSHAVTSVDKDGLLRLQFRFHCEGLNEEEPQPVFQPPPHPITSMLSMVNRLPILHPQSTVIHHKEKKDKHKLVFSVSENILFSGVGIHLSSTAAKISITLSHGGHLWANTVAGDSFSNVEPGYRELHFKKPVSVLKTERYLLTLSFYGGSSYLASGGSQYARSIKEDGCGGQNITFTFDSVEEGKEDILDGVIQDVYFFTDLLYD